MADTGQERSKAVANVVDSSSNHHLEWRIRGRKEESMAQLRLSDGPDKGSNTAHNVYPDRPGEPDCSYYTRTGTCAYGSNCRYNHPTYIGQGSQYTGDLPQREGQQECQFFLKTGMCRYKSTCKYHHPREKINTQPVYFNSFGLPVSENKPAKNLQQKEEEIRELKETLQREKQEKDQLRREIEENEHEKAKNLQEKEEEIRELKETLQREKQEKDQLRREIEDNEHEKAKNLQQKEEEIRELKETLQREKQEKDQLRREIEENEHEKLLSKEIIEQVMAEHDLLNSQRDEHFNQIQVANERRLALEKQVSDLEFFVQELCAQQDNMYCASSTALNSEFSLQELQQATQNFSETLKIGEGGFGLVYKGSLHRTTVAIKLLHSQSLQGISQFQQEITILTKVRHPNLVTLIGACSEVSALVYEYLSNGSLEDRLTGANNTPPLTWQARTRIIGEICLALIFLHSNKPQLVVHGDLKPGNILLDTNLVSKLCDFGISRLLKQPDTNTTAFLHTSRPTGTFAYIDPEYMSTGILTPKSDIYSFGIIILRLLTGKSPMNIARQVQDAMRNEILLSVIDEKAGTWPFEQAKELAKIALRCAELSRSQRPDLVNEVWAVVEPLMKAASTYVEPQSRGSELGEESIPSHFICPINQEVMQDPCIAADGFTYEADAIRQWLRRGHNTSPMTNLELPHCNLIQNHVLRSAIQEWLEHHPQS